MASPPRPLRIGSFDVLDGRIVVVDDVIPVAVEIDTSSGVQAAHTWTLEPGLRGRATAKDMVVTPRSIVVASPAAGGLVWTDRQSGDARIVPLPDDVGWLRADGAVVWAVADPDRPSAHEGFRTATERRPVVWEEPTAEDMERHRQRMSGWMVRAPDSDDDWVPAVAADAPIPSAADWHSTDDDGSDVVAPPTPVWKIENGDVTAVDFGGELDDLVAVDGRIVAVCRLPSDPLIKRVEADGYLSYIRPGTVLFGDVGNLQPLGGVGETLQGSVAVDGDDVWLLGFNRERDDRVFEVGRVDLSSGEMEPPQRVDDEVVAIVDGRTVHLGWTGGPHWDDDEEDEEPRSRGRQVRIASSDDGDDLVVEIPIVDTTPVVSGSAVWFRRYDTPGLVGVDVRSGAVTNVAVDLDVSTFTPPVDPPSDVDLAAFEADELEKLRGSLFGGWRSEGGEQHAFIRGITFESVELEGEFPRTAVVALFRADDRPGVLFGRRWNLYDDLGNAEPLEYVDINLMEDIEAAGYGLPPMSKCSPDENGIVWF